MKIANSSIDETGKTYEIHLDTLGIINGCIDVIAQALSFPHFAYNNTYGIQAINESLFQQSNDNYLMPGGCLDQILRCQALAAEGDPNFIGNNKTVNKACKLASDCENNLVEGPYLDVSNRNYYDVTAPSLDPFPPPYFLGYLSQHYVQAAIGVATNFTESTNSVYYAFDSTGDYARDDMRGGYLEDLAYLLDNGVKVSLIYGDRDYACNWIGGENASVNIPYLGQAEFVSAGYAPIHVNSSYIGGQVRQFGNLSFSRVFDAGHEVPAYQPETAYRIFSRAIFGNDIATGSISTDTNTNYSTSGSSSTWQIKNELPVNPSQQCYVLNLYATCTDDQIESVVKGTAVIHNYIVIGQKDLSADSANVTNSTGPLGGGSGTGVVGIEGPLPVTPVGNGTSMATATASAMVAVFTGGASPVGRSPTTTPGSVIGLGIISMIPGILNFVL